MIMGDCARQSPVYRTPLFDRCQADLRRKGGTAMDAAERIDMILRSLLKSEYGTGREKFRYTRKGEYRIRHCKKISLGCGYRLVFIQKDGCFIFLFAGTHDDCFRWIERNKGLNYVLDHMTREVAAAPGAAEGEDLLPPDVLEAREFVEQYEQKLVMRLDNDLLGRIFSGWHGNDADKGCKPAI